MTTIKREPVSETIARLERYVQRYERRYEISSADMLVHVKDGHCKETAEIGQWLTCYHRLKVLQGQRQTGRTIGTNTKDTGPSMTSTWRGSNAKGSFSRTV